MKRLEFITLLRGPRLAARGARATAADGGLMAYGISVVDQF
jgi:hypothetical protein